jgi:hypothetical protein
MSFDQLKKNRAKNISKLVEAASKVSGGGEKKSYGDDRFWKPTVDKAGNGYAVIRFLPASANDTLPWVRYWDHGFQGPTGLWYIENSLTTLGQDDPVSEMNSVLWNSGREEDKEIARKRKRRLHYVSNVYIVSDPGNPENEGKVFMYQYGKKIFDKIMDIMQPQFEDESPIDPFDFWNGANFKLKIRQVEGYRNYDKSEFSDTAPLLDDDDALEGIYNSLHRLGEIVEPGNFKSYAELKAKLHRVLGEESVDLSTAEQVDLDEVAAPKVTAKVVEEPTFTESSPAEEEEDDTLSYFAKLASQG